MDNSLKYMVGQCFIAAAFINDSDREIAVLERLILDYNIGGLCFFHSRASAATNFEGKKTVLYNAKSYDRFLELIQRYQNLADTPLLIMIDAEWGLSMRIENQIKYPYATTIGALKDTALAYDVGYLIAQECRAAGVHLNLAPVLDINTALDNPVIGYRSFGTDKERVTSAAQEYIRGMRAAGLLNCLKHFPGHGDTAVDSHLGLPVLQKAKIDLENEEWYPYKVLLKESDSVMIGHIAIPQLTQGINLPATLSEEIIQGILRSALNYTGPVISDALNMHAVSERFKVPGELERSVFKAGCDLLCFSESAAAGIERITDLESKDLIVNRYNKVLDLKQKAGLYDKEKKLGPKSTYAGLQPKQLIKKVAERCITITKPLKKEKSIKKIKAINAQEGDCLHGNLAESLGLECHQVELGKELDLGNERQLLILYLPSLKPKNDYGLGPETVNVLNDARKKEIIDLIIVGNPYSLSLLHDVDSYNQIVLTFERENEYQVATTKVYLGELITQGQLPFNLKK